MFSKSILSTILKALPRDQIQKYVGQHGSDRWRKSFKTWDHLVAMLTAQFSGVTSLRELEVLFSGHASHRYHLGVKTVKRSTLSDANKGRNCAVFRDIAQIMITSTSSRKEDIKEVLTILDASNITLTGRGSDWTQESKVRTNHGGLKLHIQMDCDTEMLEYSEITATNINDITAALDFPLDPGRIYIFDKGYCDYNWWYEIQETGSQFVTRLKRNAAYKVTKTCEISTEDEGFILRDQVIELTNKHPRAKKSNKLAGIPLRLIQIKHPGGKSRPFLIVSNNLEASAMQISGWYKRRWSIELLFKWVKQNLKLKRFMGQSRNAVKIQIYVALIAYILLKLYKKILGDRSRLRLKDIMVTLRTGIFTRPEMSKQRRKYRDNMFQKQQELWNLSQ